MWFFRDHSGFLDKLDRLLLTPHSFSVTLFTLGFRLFFVQKQIKKKTEAKIHQDVCGYAHVQAKNKTYTVLH